MVDPTWDESQEVSSTTGPQTAPAPLTWEGTQDLQEKYGSLPQQTTAFAEAAGRGLVGPIAPAVEELAGVDPQSILARQEANPITSGLGEAAGLIVPAALTGGASAEAKGALSAAIKFTQAGILNDIGEKVGLKIGATLGSQIGAAAARGAVENALLTGSNEISRMIIQDPAQSSESALASLGLSTVMGAVMGGGIGLTSKLWDATIGDKTGMLVEDLKSRVHEHTSADMSPESALTEELGKIHTQASQAIRLAREAAFNDVKDEVPEMLSQNIPLDKEAKLIHRAESKVAGKLEKAHDEFEPILKKFEEHFTNSDELGLKQIDSESISSYLNKLKPGSNGPKQRILEDFLDANDKYRKIVNTAYEELGQNPPLEPLAANAAMASLGKKTLGSKLADHFIENLLKKHGGKAIGASVGATIGHHTGIPGAGTLGAMLGAHTLGPLIDDILPGIGKKILDNPTSAKAFKAAVEYAAAAAKGQTLMNKAAKNLFREGAESLSHSEYPTESERNRLDKQLIEVQEDPSVLMDQPTHFQHYLPDHASAINQSMAQAVTYLNGIRSSQDRAAPLDSKPVLSSTQKTEYQNALSIAQQPLVVFDKIQRGTLTHKDLEAIQSMYPALYKGMQQKLTTEIGKNLSVGKSIPYKTRIGLSMFMAQPLDSTMSPQSLMATQIAGGKEQQRIQQQAPTKGTKSSPALQKLPKNYQTPEQARLEHKTKE